MVDHGGSIGRARALFPQAPEPWIDLSTGINPNSYPLFDLPATALTRLPEPARADDLATVAARAYGAASAGEVVAAPGTQILLPLVFGLVPPGRALVLGPTYAEHARCAALCGHAVAETDDFDDLASADLAIVVNPNNPDGRVVDRSRLLRLAEALRQRGGLLVVDEAFMDVGPADASMCAAVGEGGIVVLRSFGKFFGLAGLRLGFAVTAAAFATMLSARLGPWAVSGPALDYGLEALGDLDWQQAERVRLTQAAVRLDRLLSDHGIAVDGGTPLFRHVTSTEAPALFQWLGERAILVRAFEARPQALRFGLPASEDQWRRLAEALGQWRHGS